MRLADDALLERVYREVVRDVLFGDAHASAHPRAVIVGGQPGAGKTAAVLDARRELAAKGSGVAFINGDELRPYHPMYGQLVAADPATAADRTGADVGRWVERGIREAARSRFHSVVETTMRQPTVVARTAADFADHGFQVELRVLVVDPELSRQGIYQRYARALEKRHALPRFTLAKYHDDALAQMPATLAAVAASVHQVRFVDRQGRELQAASPVASSPVSILHRLRASQLPPDVCQLVGREWGRLRSVLDRDGMPDVVREGVRQEQARFAAWQARQDAGGSPGQPSPQRDRER